jgi:trehalose 6-phosphate phosphatase
VNAERRSETSGAEIESAVAALASEPEHGAVLFDLDGTLAPIVQRPEDSSVPERTRELVERVAGRYGMTVVVSGRRAAEARRILGLDSIAYVGNHGYELLAPGAGGPEPVPALAGHERDAADFLASYGAGGLERMGVRIEDKAAIVALHWRGAADEQSAETEAALAAAEAKAAGLLVHRGRKVIELRPPVRTDKGRGIEALLGPAHFIRRALYAGDDRTDVDAFRVLRRMTEGGRLQQGVCVAVTSEEAPAEVRLAADLAVPGPEGFVAVLEALA